MTRSWRPLLALGLAMPVPVLAQPGTVAETYTYVVMRDANGALVQGPVRGDAFPLWPVRSCYTWVVVLAGPNRSVEITELQRTPGPTRFDVTSDITINQASDGTMWKRRVSTQGGISGTWCVNDADPPGEYLYQVLVNGAPVANFRFCGIRVDEGETVRLESLSCKGRFLGS
jgi:hypothetical protein